MNLRDLIRNPRLLWWLLKPAEVAALVAILLVLAVTCAGCAGPHVVARGDPNAEMVVRWVYDTRRCQAGFVACIERREVGGRVECFIFAREPRGWEDVERLESVGHELWHCAGARHE